MEHFENDGGLNQNFGKSGRPLDTAEFREYRAAFDASYPALWRTFTRPGGAQGKFHRAHQLERCGSRRIGNQVVGVCACVELWNRTIATCDGIICERFVKNPGYLDGKLDYPGLVLAVFGRNAETDMDRHDRLTRGAMASTANLKSAAFVVALADDVQRAVLITAAGLVGWMPFYSDGGFHRLIAERVARTLGSDPAALARNMPKVLADIRAVVDAVAPRERDHCSGELVSWYEARILHPVSHIPGFAVNLSTGREEVGESGHIAGVELATRADGVERAAAIVLASTTGKTELERRVGVRLAECGEEECVPLLVKLLDTYLLAMASGSTSADALRTALAAVAAVELSEEAAATVMSDPDLFRGVLEAIELTVAAMD